MAADSGVEHDEQVHPIVGFCHRLEAALDDVGDAAAWSLTPEEERAVLTRLAACSARVGELRLRVLAAADRDDVGKVDGSPSTGAWLAAATRAPRARARADVTLARALDERRLVARDALAHGWLDGDQARVVVTAVEALPAVVSEADRRRAEEHLVALAAVHDAVELRVLARRLHEVIDPEGADEELGRRLAREEREARRATYLRLWEHDDGTTSGRFRIPTLHAHMLRKALDAFTSPRRSGRRELGRHEALTSRPELLGRGLCELIERFPAERMPASGGLNATVVVTLSLEQLRADLGAAALDTGGSISAGEARRLACAAGIIPAVLDGRSMPVDLGREQRLHNRYQRIALGLRQRTCAEEHCDRPAAWAEAHHKHPWARGGSTSVENGELLCSWHHHTTAPTTTPTTSRGDPTEVSASTGGREELDASTRPQQACGSIRRSSSTRCSFERARPSPGPARW